MLRKLFHKKHTARVCDLFPEFEDYSWVRGDAVNICKSYGKKNKCRVVRAIFHSFMNLVMDDIVEGHIFQLPSYGGMLYVEEVPAHALEKMKATGFLQGFDNAMIRKPHIPTYRFISSNGSHHKFRVILDKVRYLRLLRNQHEGKNYSGNIGIW